MERRIFRRKPIAIDGEARSSTGTFAAVISDISEDGLCFAAERTCNVGEHLSLTWRLQPHEHPMDVECRVRYSTPERTGVEFLNLATHDRLRIMYLLTV